MQKSFPTLSNAIAIMKYPCHRELQPASRREFLSRWGMGFGSVALAALMQTESRSALNNEETSGSDRAGRDSYGILERLHHPAKAKHVIFLYMDGGPSQMDTFDPKPALDKYHGQPFPASMEPTQFDNVGSTLASPWKFNQYGESGLWISDLFPHIAKQADELCVIRTMTSQFSEHTSANYFLHTGQGIVGRPSVGAWTVYGLGSEAEELPGFVVINGGLTPPGGLDNFASGFLPATYQGSIFSPKGDAIANLKSAIARSPERMEAKRQLLRRLDESFLAESGTAGAVESAIKNYELAYRMQQSVPDASNLNMETAATREMYGVDHANGPTAIFARECLLARRLVERGVRFIELTCPAIGHDRWDQHANLKQGHDDNALAVDQPIAALLADLRDRGLLDETLVVWAGEFGRTPFAQGSNGRDHNPFAFSIWMAGGGVKGGMVYGETDEFGYKAVERPVEMHDLHATLLHLLGVDHERLTFRFGGRDHRLTDVHGHVLHDVVA